MFPAAKAPPKNRTVAVKVRALIKEIMLVSTVPDAAKLACCKNGLCIKFTCSYS
jgi:hypothetical protein